MLASLARTLREHMLVGEWNLVTLGAGIVAVLFAAFIVYRRVACPISGLIRAVRVAAAERAPEADASTRFSTLVDDFNRLIEVADQELHASSRLAALVESSGDAIIGQTLDGIVTSWNAAATTMFGYSADEIVGRKVTAILPSDRPEQELILLGRAKNGEPVQQLETIRTRKDGTRVNVSITVSPIRDRASNIVGLSTVSRDTTERNRTEAERRVLAERLAQSERLETVGQLAGGIAHDFNNLLAVIINYSSFVLAQTEGQPAVQADVRQIELAAERGARLTKQLLTFARSDAIKTETLDLNAIVVDVHDLLSRTLGEHVELVLGLTAGEQVIAGDRGQLDQVLLNLALNARDAMPDGGTLTLETSQVDVDEAYVQLHPTASPGHYVQLAVTDTGTGMTPDVASRIFEPFFTTKTRDQGTGLGLATVYGIVTKAGGFINLYSEPGVGSTFRLLFPAVDQPASAATTATDPAIHARGSGETILVVEDEPAVLELTARILREHGYDVLQAATFEDALAIAAARDFDLLITDSVMPNMSGRVLARNIDELRPGRPVLLMSGYSAGVVHQHAVVDHDAAFIQKPFDRRTLLGSVHTILTSRQPDHHDS